MNPDNLIGWSSFPSDHAVLFFCLGMGLWLISRRLGAIALAYALLGACFPRVYVGIHYPTDILAGAALGIGIACFGMVDWIRNAVIHPMLYWQEHYPASFNAFLFLFSFEIAEQFDSVRTLYHGAKIVEQALR
jgi:undecaprenyl-diphosphatase